MTDNPKIAIFVDSLDQHRRRYCYWIDYFVEKRTPFELFSISDQRSAVVERQNRNLPRLDDFDLIIFNWDVANGDFAWLADETLEFFQNRGRNEILRWVGNGSRVLIEIQSAAGYPLQELYDAILGVGEVHVSPYRRTEAFRDADEQLVRNHRRHTHPIVHDLYRQDGIIETKYRPFPHVVFPGFDKSEDSTYARNRRALSFGNFVRWSRNWYPILLRRRPDVLGRNRQAVALVRTVGDKGGEIVVTTMRIANSQNHDLIDAMVNVTPESRAARQRFFLLATRRRKLVRAMLIGVAWIVGIAVFVPIVNYLAQFLQNWTEDSTCRLQGVSPKECKDSASFMLGWVRNLKAADASMMAVVVSLWALSAKIWKSRDRY